MKTAQLLLWPLLAAIGLAARSSADRYKTNISKSQPITLTDSKFVPLTQAPRDYAVVVLLTAVKPQYGCTMCQAFAPSWDFIAKTWTKSRKDDSRIIFATLDFQDGRDTFQALGLQTAPVVLLYPPTSGPNAKSDSSPLRFSFSSGEAPAESVHSWIARQLPDTPTPKFVRPLNYTKIAVLVTLFLGMVTVLVVAWPIILPLIQNRNLWAAISLIAVLLFTSGHMFNHIRKVPYVTGDGKGGVTYFAGGFQNQFGMETQIIAALYGVLSFAAISLALKVPRISDPHLQTLTAFVWAGIMFLVYSFLLSVFKIKNGGYPFWLPPF